MESKLDKIRALARSYQMQGAGEATTVADFLLMLVEGYDADGETEKNALKMIDGSLAELRGWALAARKEVQKIKGDQQP